MTLQENLDRIKAKIESKLPQEHIAIMHQATRDLETSGIGDGILKVGDAAPVFSLMTQEGKVVRSADLYAKKSLAITFYRGVWCPYCNMDLSTLNKYKARFEEEGMTLVGISPQLPKYNQQVVTRQRLNFDLLSDEENKMASQFGLRWEMIAPLKTLYRDTFKINLPHYNGDDSWTLPIPSRFIIGTDGIIKYAEYSIDYTKRPSPEALFEKM